MNIVPSSKHLILAAALALGLASAASAQNANVAVPNPGDGKSAALLGVRYAGASFSYVDVADTGYDARNYGFECNHSLTANLDARLEFDYLRSEGLGGVSLSGKHYSLKTLSAVGRAFADWQGTTKAYVEAGAGYVWFRAPLGNHDNAWQWLVGAGVEINIAPSFSLTPFVRYQDAIDFSLGSTWNYGLRANYALTEHVGLTAKLERDDDQNMNYSIGANFRF